MPEPKIGERGFCKSCNGLIEYVGPFWRHVGNTPRHSAEPKTDDEKPEQRDPIADLALCEGIIPSNMEAGEAPEALRYWIEQARLEWESGLAYKTKWEQTEAEAQRLRDEVSRLRME